MSANDIKLEKINHNNLDWEIFEIISKTLLLEKICTKKLQYEQLTSIDFYGV